jgi:hypothetical protein
LARCRRTTLRTGLETAFDGMLGLLDKNQSRNQLTRGNQVGLLEPKYRPDSKKITNELASVPGKDIT